MKKCCFPFLASIITLSNICATATYDKCTPSEKEKAQVAEALHNGGIRFTQNKGQMSDIDGNPAPYVLFKAEVPNLNIWVTTNGLTYQFFKLEDDTSTPLSGASEMEQERGVEKIKGEWCRVDMVLKGALIKKENVITEGDVTSGDVNYYLGHCPDGIFNVRSYSKIVIKDVYPGIDWVLRNSSSAFGESGSGLKHDFIVHPNADPGQIKLIYEGVGKLKIRNNQIHFENELGEITEGKLLCYQGSEINPITSKYTVRENKNKISKGFSYEVGIQSGKYNTDETLTIDPQLTWASFFGGSALDGPMSIDRDANGNVYVTGYTSSVNFPLRNWAGAFNQAVSGSGGPYDIFILRFNNAGILIWSTYYGGGFWDFGYSIACDGANNVYVTGYTSSANFPTQVWPGAYNQAVSGGGDDIIILRFNNLGIRTWATHYGGGGTENGNSIVCDGANNIYVTGFNSSGSFPTFSWAGAYNQAAYGGSNDVVILRFTNIGVLTWATYYGGSGLENGYCITHDGANNVYVSGNTSGNFPTTAWAGAYNQAVFGGGGYDAYLLRFDNSGSSTWATYFGGTGNDNGYTTACDLANNIYLTGQTDSPNFPVQNWVGAYNQTVSGGGVDAYILRLNNFGALTWSTYYGGSGSEYFNQFSTHDNIAIDGCGNIYVGFETNSSNINTYNSGCSSYFDNTFGGGLRDQFYVKFNSSGVLLWATYFGGGSSDYRVPIVLDVNGNLFGTGEWIGYASGVGLPLVNPGGGAYYDSTPNGTDDGCVLKFSPPLPGNTQSQTNNISCSPCSGSATINLFCSETNYSYVWSNGSSTINSASATNTITGLCPGTYTVTATSNCNQTQTANFIISGLTCAVCNLAGEFTKGTSNCNGCGCKEWILITATGGTMPYNYTWPDGYVHRYKNNLCPGAYLVNVKDKNGCSVNVNLTTP